MKAIVNPVFAAVLATAVGMGCSKKNEPVDPVPGADPPKVDSRNDEERLQGTWAVVSFEKDGHKEQDVADKRVIIKGSELSLTVEGADNLDFLGGTCYGGELTDPIDIRELRQLLKKSGLPDQMVEQDTYYLPSSDGKSRFFSVRTSEKDAELVEARINDALVGRLQRISMSYTIASGNKEVTLAFVDPVKKAARQDNDLALVSRSKVALRLTSMFRKKANSLMARNKEAAAQDKPDAKALEEDARMLLAASQQFVLDGLGREDDGRYHWMVLRFATELPETYLKEILDGVQRELAWPQPTRLENFDSEYPVGTRATFTFKLAPQGTPKGIALHKPAGPQVPVLGIYKLEGDSLTLCVCSEGGRNKNATPIDPSELVRPTSFSSAGGNILVILTRKTETREQKLARLLKEVEKLQKEKAAGEIRPERSEKTILLYAIDFSRFPEGKVPDDWYPRQMAERLKKRIDPAGLYNIAVRPVGKAYMEIIILIDVREQLEARGKQLEADTKCWNNVLTEASVRWPPRIYDVAAGRKIELLALISAQYPGVSIKVVGKFIDDNYKPREAGKPDPDAWKALLTQVMKQGQWPLREYVVAPGRFEELAHQVKMQHPEVSEKEVTDHLRPIFDSGNGRHGPLVGEEVEQIRELIAQDAGAESGILKLVPVSEITTKPRASDLEPDDLEKRLEELLKEIQELRAGGTH